MLFVGGSARSGTSLVQKLLVSHSAIAGGPEFDHTRAIVELYRQMTEPWRLERQSLYYDRETLTRHFVAFYENLTAGMAARKPGAELLSEKTPSNVYVAGTLLDLWPDALYVNVVRDGRDVVLSHLDVNRRYREQGQRNPEPDTLVNVCRHWNRCAEEGLALADRPELRDRVYTVRFEDLVAHPDRELAGLVAFAGLEVQDRQRRPELITEEETGVALEGAYFTRELYRQPFNPEKSGRWRRDMGPLQRVVVTRLLRDNLERLGYAI